MFSKLFFFFLQNLTRPEVQGCHKIKMKIEPKEM